MDLKNCFEDDCILDRAKMPFWCGTDEKSLDSIAGRGLKVIECSSSLTGPVPNDLACPVDHWSCPGLQNLCLRQPRDPHSCPLCRTLFSNVYCSVERQPCECVKTSPVPDFWATTLVINWHLSSGLCWNSHLETFFLFSGEVKPWL